MKKFFIFATALAALASCSSDDFVGESPNGVNGQIDGAISFNMGTTAVTRAGGSDAATALSNQFIVYGEKNETADGAAPATGKLVFQNYKVAYGANTAYTTTSNTKDWEYVGQKWTSDEQSHITTSTTDNQTIKYWDYGAATYTFTAVSALPSDISSGRVSIQKITEKTTDNKVYDKGYTITLAKTSTPSEEYPTLNKLYFSDRQVIGKTAGTDRNATNTYGGNVTLQFRNFMSHIRAGVYETIPGYDITAISFFVDDGAGNQTTLAQVSSTNAFGAKCPNTSTTDYEGTITVTYYESGAVLNQPKVKAEGGTSATNLILGTNMSTISDATNNQLGKEATHPTWDKADGDFTEVIPQIENTTNLKLKCNYTLWNSVTKEIITVEGATAEVPGKYLQWKSNYKYTYLFKISDNTNGHTGTSTDPAGLYPITFDAVEVLAANGEAEYITTVSEPSITTFGAIYYNDSDPTKSKYTAYQTGNNEYQAQTGSYQLDIFATFTEGSTVKTPVVGTSGAQCVNVFAVTTPDATNFPITEASVAEAIANPGKITNAVYTYDGTSTYTEVTDASTLASGTTYYKADNSSRVPGGDGYVQTVAEEGTDYEVAPKIKAVNINSDNSEYFTAIPAKVTTVPAEDGTTKTIDALKLTGVKAGTYAIEYEASSAWTGTYKKVYKIIVVQ